MCNKYNWPIFAPAEDSALLAAWLRASADGEMLHALMDEEFNQGFIAGRMLTLMEQQLDEEPTDDQE